MMSRWRLAAVCLGASFGVSFSTGCASKMKYGALRFENDRLREHSVALERHMLDMPMRADRVPGSFGGSADRQEASPAPAAGDRLPTIPQLAVQSSIAAGAQTAPAERRVVVYTAGLTVVVKDSQAAIEATTQLAEEMKGYVQKIVKDQIVIRVPAGRFREAVDRIERLGTVSDRRIEAADVTEEYVDLEARIRHYEAVLARLRQLLEKAQDAKDTLAVEKELARVGEELERLRGKMQLLQNRVAYSTITISFERVARTPGDMKPVLAVPFEWVRELDLKRLLGRDL